MGQAKARGTFEQRKALAVERRRIEAEQREQERLQAIRAKHEAVRKLPPQKRRDAVLLGGGHTPGQTMALMAALVASGAMSIPLVTLDEGTKRRYRK